MILTGLIAARSVHFIALALAFGAVAYASFGDDSLAVDRRLRRVAAWSSLGVLVTALLVLAITAANMVGDLSGAVDAGVWSAILGETEFGRVWAVRLALALGLLTAVLLRPKSRPRGLQNGVALVLAGGLAATVALTGHAQTEGGVAGVVHRASDAVHLVAAAVWLGVLPPLLFLLWSRGPDATAAEATTAARRLKAFHAVGLGAVLALTGTGIVNAWFLVGDVANLFTTTYGRLLLAKLALFAVMVMLAADNRLRLVPALERSLQDAAPPGPWLRRLRGHIRGEFVLGIAVLLTVAVLGSIEPSREAM